MPGVLVVMVVVTMPTTQYTSMQCSKLSGKSTTKLKVPVEGDRRVWGTIKGCCWMCIVGCRVVILPETREKAMEMLHKTHPGTAWMSHLPEVTCGRRVWIDHWRKVLRSAIPVTHHADCTNALIDVARVFVDYASPMDRLVIADAHSKWIDIRVTNSATSSATIELLRKTFSCLGLPEVVVSDNIH